VTLALTHYVMLACLIFTVGAAGFLVRRNVLVQLMSIELMLGSANLLLIAFNRYATGSQSGQLFAFFVIAVAAAEAAVGLAIVISLFRLGKSVETDRAALLKG